MAWTIEYDPRAVKDLNGLDRPIRAEIFAFLRDRIAPADDPRLFGKPLRHGKYGLWRYRMRDFRILCELQDARGIVLVVGVGHRKDVYR